MRPLALRSSFGGMSIPNVSIDHQGFAGTITHTDGMIRKRKTERNTVHVHNNRYNTSTNRVCSEYERQVWKQSWHSPEEFNRRLTVCWGKWRTGVPKRQVAASHWSILGQMDKIALHSGEQNIWRLHYTTKRETFLKLMTWTCTLICPLLSLK